MLNEALKPERNLLTQDTYNLAITIKGYRRLNNITVRRLRKVTVHCFLSLIVVQAQALHSATSNRESSIRQCVHAFA
ncbi:hypothetical protein ES703_54968 [subsurface metagenome]